MADDERIHRSGPERTGPHRSFAGVYRSDPWSERDDFWHRRNGFAHTHGPESEHITSFEDRAGSFDHATASFTSVAQQAVDLAYQISEPYLRAGLHAAEAYTARENGTRESFETAFQEGDAMNRPYGDPMVQMYGQLARTYAEFVISMARAAYGGWYQPGYAAYPRRRDWCDPCDDRDRYDRCDDRDRFDRSRCYTPPPPSYYPPPWKHRHWHRLEIKVDIAAGANRRASEPQIQWYRYSEHFKLAWLRSAKNVNAALAVNRGPYDGVVTYTVTVAPNTEVGTYTGPIVDDKDHPVGNVTIEITGDGNGGGGGAQAGGAGGGAPPGAGGGAPPGGGGGGGGGRGLS